MLERARLLRCQLYISPSWITGDVVRQQMPYRCHSRNHGLLACISLCLRFAAEMSLRPSGLASGTVKMRSNHSISAMLCSTSICQLVYPMALQVGSPSTHRTFRHAATKDAQIGIRRSQRMAGDSVLSRAAILGGSTLGKIWDANQPRRPACACFARRTEPLARSGIGWRAR